MSLSQSLEVEAELEETKAKLKQVTALFDKYIEAIESARRQYNDSSLWCWEGIEDGLDDICQEFWNLK